jgi:hypothetical protein
MRPTNDGGRLGAVTDDDDGTAVGRTRGPGVVLEVVVAEVAEGLGPSRPRVALGDGLRGPPRPSASRAGSVPSKGGQ